MINEPITAPSLLWMHTRRARILAAVVICAALFSVLSDLRRVQSVVLLVLALMSIVAGIVGVLVVRTDPMPKQIAILVGATPPIAVLLTCLAIPGPLSNPNQTNAFGAGVAVCAFLCVRGRIGIAWASLSIAIAIFPVWSWLTGQGVWTGLILAVPNFAVLSMATLFALTVRPAAEAIRQLHAQSIRESETIAETGAREQERDQQRHKLQDLAWPTLELIAAGTKLTKAQIVDSALIEAQLRDSVRARMLDKPNLVAAVRNARSRGLDVIMIDDKGMDDVAEQTVDSFCEQVASWLSGIPAGRITVRVHPPSRPWLATAVAVAPDGAEHQLYLKPDGTTTAL